MAKGKGTAGGGKEDAAVRAVRELLDGEYLPSHPGARVDVYRHNSASIRVRVIDPEFTGRRLTARDGGIWELLESRLPEDVLEQISLLLLLAPRETKKSLMNLEFEDPTPLNL